MADERNCAARAHMEYLIDGEVVLSVVVDAPKLDYANLVEVQRLDMGALDARLKWAEAKVAAGGA